MWLTSWYPNPYEPTNGDFIKRQAEAVSKIVLVDVIHVVQAGIELHTKAGAIHEREGNLREIIQSFPFKKWGIDLIDKIRYNIKYHIFIRNLINSYAAEFGRPQLIHVHIPVKAGLHALYFADLWGIKYLVTEHASHYTKNSHDSFFNRSNFYKRNVFKVMKDASTVVSVSNAVGSVLKQLFPIKNYQTIRNTVDITLFNYKPVNNKIFRWIHVSSMHNYQKNIYGIINAFTELNKQHTDWELIMVGPCKEEQKQKVVEAGLADKIIFIGEVDYKEVAEQMQQANAFVLFSRHENFPCVIEEALCCGLPVVTSNAGGIAEAINETNGLLVDIENTQALTIAMLSLMNHYADYNRAAIAKAAIALYNKETIAQQIVELYKQIVELYKEVIN